MNDDDETTTITTARVQPVKMVLFDGIVNSLVGHTDKAHIVNILEMVIR